VASSATAPLNSAPSQDFRLQFGRTIRWSSSKRNRRASPNSARGCSFREPSVNRTRGRRRNCANRFIFRLSKTPSAALRNRSVTVGAHDEGALWPALT